MDVRPVVVGVDGSAAAFAAAQWAAAEAGRRKAPLRMVDGYVWPAQGHLGRVRLGDDAEGVALELTMAQLALAADAARELEPDLDVTTSVMPATPVEAIVTASRSAQLVVLGSRGLGGFAAMLVGSTGIGVAARAACPVVIVRGDAAETLGGPVVVGVDGSASSDAVVSFAFDCAAQRQVPLVAVHAWDLIVQDLFGFGAMGVDWEAIELEEYAVLADRLAGWAEKYPDVEVVRVVDRGAAAGCLLERAEGASLVVVGARGRGAITGLVLGSTSHALLHHAPCPVVVVPPIAAD